MSVQAGATLQDGRIRLQLARAGFALDVDFALPAEGITALFGPSGSGKTTVLRCVAGLERAAGTVRIAGSTWQDDERGVFLPTWQRPLGYVFQEASLFDHLDVRRNLEYGLKRTRGAGRGALDHAVDLLGIGHLVARRTSELSGGERQRVAIARALATQPRVLLLDEPLAALDAARRQEILPWLERLRDESRVPMLYVSHAADEVARLARTLVVIDQGRVTAAGPLSEVVVRGDVPGLAGDDAGAVLQAQVTQLDAAWHLAQVAFEGGTLWLAGGTLAPGAQVRVRVLARDVSLALAPPQGSSIQNVLPCTVTHIAPGPHPSQVLVQLACGPAGAQSLLLSRTTARAAAQLALRPGMALWAQVKSAALVP